MNEEIKTVPFITDIPQSTIGLKIEATMYVDGKVVSATMEINDADVIREGMLKGEEWEDENARYALTEEAKKELGLE